MKNEIQKRKELDALAETFIIGHKKLTKQEQYLLDSSERLKRVLDEQVKQRAMILKSLTQIGWALTTKDKE